MIRIDGETFEIEINGELRGLMAEMTTMIHTLYAKVEKYMGEEDAKALFEYCFDTALIPEEELQEQIDYEIFRRMVGDDDEETYQGR